MVRLWNWISNISTAWGLLPSAVATSVGGTLWVLAMAIAGYFEQVPIFWMMMALPLAAAAIITLALRLSEWRVRISAAGKLIFHGVQLGGDYVKAGKGRITGIAGVQVRLLLQSTATFPISFIVEEFQSSFEGRYPPNKPRADRGGVAAVNEIKAYTDHVIPLGNMPIQNQVTGTAKFKIRYGHPGREKYVIAQDLQYHAGFDEKEGAYLVAMQQQSPATI